MFGVLSWVNRVSAVQELEQGFASVLVVKEVNFNWYRKVDIYVK